MPTATRAQLTQLKRNSRLSAQERQAIAQAEKEIISLERKVKTLETHSKSESALQKNAVVKKIVAKQVKSETDQLNQTIRELKLQLTSEAKLKTNPKVNSLLHKELGKQDRKYQTQINRLESQNSVYVQENKLLKEKLKAVATKPIPQKDFNSFITSSIQDLQESFNQASAGSDTEVIIRDIDIEAKVITELKNNQPVYILPSREDMKELSSENFQRIKYSLSIVPKDMD